MIFRQALDQHNPLYIDSNVVANLTYPRELLARLATLHIPCTYQSEIRRLRKLELESIRLRKELIAEYSTEFSKQLPAIVDSLPTLYPEEFV